MIDIFYPEDVQKILRGKHIVFLGDSNVRAMYKDLLLLSQQARFLTNSERKAKMEKSFCGDQLIYHGEKSNGRNYREEREAKSQGCKFSFCFLTRVYDSYVKEKLKKFSSSSHQTNVFVINSCLWDVSRWGPRGVDEYKENLKKLMKQLQEILSPDCLVIWLTCPPIATELKGGFLVKQLEFLKYSLRFHVMEANHFAHKVVVSHGFDVLDVHYHFKMQLMRREEDGIHWQSPAVRYRTNLLLTHICLAWGTPLPHRYECAALLHSLDDVSDEVVIESKKQKIDVKNGLVPVKNSVSAAGSTESKAAVEDKENCSTPKTSKAKKKKRTPRWWKSVARSHHAFMSHMQYADRKKRIRQWQPETSTPPSPFNPDVQSNMHPFPSAFNPQLRSQMCFPSSPFNFQLQSPSPPFNPQLQSLPSPFNPQWQPEMSTPSPRFNPQLYSKMPVCSPFNSQWQPEMSAPSSPLIPQLSPHITAPTANCLPMPHSVMSQRRPKFNSYMQQPIMY